MVRILVSSGRRCGSPLKPHRRRSPSSPNRKRRRELEEGFNSIEDRRDQRIRAIKEVAKITSTVTAFAITQRDVPRNMPWVMWFGCSVRR